MNIRAKAVGLALLLTLGISSVASAASGFVTGNVNLRAGPSTDYPVVTTLRAGDGLEIYGCLSGYSWCDVNWRGYRGWVSSLYLESYYDDRRVGIAYARPAIISFSFGNYWDSYYTGRSFYRDRYRYDYNDYYDDDDYYDNRRRDRREYRLDRRERREGVRQDRRRQDARQDRRQDRRIVRRERRIEQRQERRREVRQDRRQERRQAVRQERRQERRQAVRQERRQERRAERRQDRGGSRICIEGQAC